MHITDSLLSPVLPPGGALVHGAVDGDEAGGDAVSRLNRLPGNRETGCGAVTQSVTAGAVTWLGHCREQQLWPPSHHPVYGHQYGHHFQLGELHMYLLLVASLLVVLIGTYLVEVQAEEMSAWLV